MDVGMCWGNEDRSMSEWVVNDWGVAVRYWYTSSKQGIDEGVDATEPTKAGEHEIKARVMKGRKSSVNSEHIT